MPTFANKGNRKWELAGHMLRPGSATVTLTDAEWERAQQLAPAAVVALRERELLEVDSPEVQDHAPGGDSAPAGDGLDALGLNELQVRATALGITPGNKQAQTLIRMIRERTA